MDFLNNLVGFSGAFIIAFYVLLYGFYACLLLVSIYGIWRQPRRARLTAPEVLLAPATSPPVTVIVPAHNEEVGIVSSVQALLALRYPNLELVVVNDGSTDLTLPKLVKAFALRKSDIRFDPIIPTEPVTAVYLSTVEPRLLVVDKKVGGKSDALNAGLNLCRTPWICSQDADSILEEDALLRVMRPAVEDTTVVASSGIVRIANGCQVVNGRVVRVGLPSQSLAVFQVIEYLRGFLQGRLGWSWLNGLLVISGTFGVFRTDVLRAVGGYSRETVAEDMEIVVRIHRYFQERREKYRVVFVPDPVCWTEAPSDASSLRSQRRRWHRGLAETLSMEEKTLFRPGTGVLGFLALPYFVLELIAPIVELFGLIFIPTTWLLGWLDTFYLLSYFLFAFLLSTLFSFWAVLMEEFTYRRYSSWSELLRLVFFSLLEHLGYHQLLTWWRIEGLFDFMKGHRAWDRPARRGLSSRALSEACVLVKRDS